MTKSLSEGWLTTTVAEASATFDRPALYATVRGHRVTAIAIYKRGLYIVTYSGGGKRYLSGEKLLYYRSVDSNK